MTSSSASYSRDMANCPHCQFTRPLLPSESLVDTTCARPSCNGTIELEKQEAVWECRGCGEHNYLADAHEECKRCKAKQGDGSVVYWVMEREWKADGGKSDKGWEIVN